MRIHKTITLSLVGITTCCGLVLSSVRSYADGDSAVSNASVTVPVSCIMSSTIDTAHNATLSPGTYSGASGSQYENGIGKTTLTTYCNDNNGFSIYAIGFTGDSYDGENHTKLVGTTASGNATIATKVYESSDTTSNWSMKVTKVENPTSGDPITYNPQNMSITNSFNSWHVIPDTYTKVAEYHATTGSSTTDTALGAKVETTYASYIAPTQAADTYTGKVKYTMVHPYNVQPLQPQIATSDCINYFPNGYNVGGTMGCQEFAREKDMSECTYTDHSTYCYDEDWEPIDPDTLPDLDVYKDSNTLLASNYSREGYGFAGWSTTYDYSDPSGFYGPNETLTIDAEQYTDDNPGLSLYAIWVKSEGNLQDSATVANICNRLTTAKTDGISDLSSVSALTDQRDNNTYAIAKLADGKCWMIENLRLGNTAELTLSNTNNPLNDGTNVILKHNYTDTDTYNTLSPHSDRANYASDPYSWCYHDSANCIDQSRLRTDNTASRKTGATKIEDKLYGYGNYYNWYSATAGNGTYGIASGSVTGDLCPNGWHLPTGTNSGEFNTLNINANSGSTNSDAGLVSYPNNFVYSGSILGDFIYIRDYLGYYWSSATYSSLDAYSLVLSPTKVNASSYSTSEKYYGQTVRCVAN